MGITIADDSALFRSDLVLLLEASGGAGDRAGVLRRETHRPHLSRTGRANPVILDLRMPPTFTSKEISTAAEIRGHNQGIGILVLSTFAEASYGSRLIGRGRPRIATCSRTERHRRRSPAAAAGKDRGQGDHCA